MSSTQVKAAQDTFTNVSYKELIRRGTEAKSGCVTKDKYCGEMYDPDATSYSMFLAATNEAARRYEVSEPHTLLTQTQSDGKMKAARGGTGLSRPDEETFDEKEGWSDNDEAAQTTNCSGTVRNLRSDLKQADSYSRALRSHQGEGEARVEQPLVPTPLSPNETVSASSVPRICI
jgi:hypothetical protein